MCLSQDIACQVTVTEWKIRYLYLLLSVHDSFFLRPRAYLKINVGTESVTLHLKSASVIQVQKFDPNHLAFRFRDLQGWLKLQCEGVCAYKYV